jgi:thioredoxin-related protein
MKINLKKITLGAMALILLSGAAAFALHAAQPSDPPATKTRRDRPVPVTEITWMSWDDAMKAMEKQPKKVFIDLYTDWCGWCKRMDQTTFADPQVVEFVNKHFYAVKFDAEGKQDVTYNGHTFKFMASGSRGVHELAYSLLDGRLGYPSYVYMNEKMERITISPGYKPTDTFLKELRFINGEHYKTKSYQDYMNSSEGQ